MIRHAEGNLLDSDAEALVNTVNEIGVMGKGIALAFRDAFPDNTSEYAAACHRHDVHVGQMFVTRTNALMGPKWIINFPTKKHWRHPSRLEWIREGLADLARVIEENGIKSIALPPLGCGNGGLNWPDVSREITAALDNLLGVDVIVYPPAEAYRTATKTVGVDRLTPARALIAEMVRQYSVLGIECSMLEIQKLAWFLQRTIRRLALPDPLKLRFVPHFYGPYADRLRHLLDGLDGSYLHCEKRLADAGPLEPIYFADQRRSEVEIYLAGEEAKTFQPALDATVQLIDGFQSPLGMELMATVDWLISDGGCPATVQGIREGLARWPKGKKAAERKRRLFDDRLIGLALGRLTGVAQP
ncbi:type II toxin-antitoxin system antitoxin DNA ADP-ribosyl glycohydrolase DarG [Zavarzinella formosa]|uniref:type II toxin-antitoxin system antitoxin DNA ADP-ribosyl glycohydrolase DarG n=1 Tax=Zavarzinella formosa TaxID=360055 RepID=UPI00031ABFF4|nr:macro domain-containing protein [Zavarzinella formosa]